MTVDCFFGDILTTVRNKNYSFISNVEKIKWALCVLKKI